VRRHPPQHKEAGDRWRVIRCDAPLFYYLRGRVGDIFGLSSWYRQLAAFFRVHVF
jgi:hypothetical protein